MTPRTHTYAGGAWARAVLIASSILLTTFGLVMVYSASMVTAAAEGPSWKYAAQQGAFIALGIFGALIIARMDYRTLRSLSMASWGVLVGVLFLTLAMGLVGGGAKRWVAIAGMRFQPSEFMKIIMMMVVASAAAKWMRGKMPGTRFAREVAVLALIPMTLIILQPDFGTTAVIAMGLVTILVVAGMPIRPLVMGVGGLGVLGAGLIMLSDYRRARVFAFFDPWSNPQGDGYQIIQALLAFGSGGVDGVGLSLSRQKYFYLPAAHTDFILAIIGEEFGLIGTLGVVLLLGAFVWAVFRIAMGCRDPFGKLLAASLGAMFATQSALNMGAVTSIIPITGKTLPFLSYGGSSVIATLLVVGLLISISTHGAAAPRPVRSHNGIEDVSNEGVRERRRDRGAHPSRIERGPAVRRRAR